MAVFSSLSERLNHIFSKLTKHGRLTELEIKGAMREVRVALLEADVNIFVAKKFIADVSEKAVGQEILKSLNPAQQVIKIVNEELIALMGSTNAKLEVADKPPAVIMMCGLQGAGKTTLCGKLAVLLKKQGKKPLLVACDIYRPAAINQLQVVGGKAGAEVFEKGTQNPVKTAKQAVEYARSMGFDPVIIDTAGRLHIDDALMQELENIKAEVHPNDILLTVDAMTGQDAVNVADTFNKRLDVTGVILTKLDGDTRGGACLSIKAVTGKPIKFIGVGEKLTDLEPFYPDRMASRILGMGDVLSLIEKAQEAVTEEQAKKMVNSEEHKQVAREVAREGTVLLKNTGVLPLGKDLKNVAVIGPNADVIYNYLGDYTAPQERSKVVTLLDAIRQRLPNANVYYEKGCAIRDTTTSDIPAAVEAAKKADVVIVAVGGSSARDFKTKYIETGAATVSSEGNEVVSDMECGEGFDRSTLNLLGDQEKLIRALAATGKPLVIVYIAGRPLLMNLAAEVGNALLMAWYPGEQGGNGIADVLFGDYNPSGRLPMSVPRNVGQLPIHYSQGVQRDYMDGPGTPLYAFGYGLSYTTFSYSNLKLTSGDGKNVLQKVTCTVTNTGNCDGTEIAQLYINDEVSSVVTPPVRLKGFQRIELKKGESREVTFELTAKDLSIYDRNMNFVVEPGKFNVMVGSASDNLPLKGSFEVE